MAIYQELLSKTHMHYRMKDNFLHETVYRFKNRWKTKSAWYPVISWISSILLNPNIANDFLLSILPELKNGNLAKGWRQVELIAKSSKVN